MMRYVKHLSDYRLFLLASELEALFSTIRASGAVHAKRDELLFTIYAFTGIRRSEALALKWSDYDSITKNLCIRISKGGRQRAQPVPMRLAKLMENQVGCDILKDEDNQFLFSGTAGKTPSVGTPGANIIHNMETTFRYSVKADNSLATGGICNLAL